MREYDLVIRGGTIVDGTGVPRYKGDLAIKDGRIAKISGKINTGAAKEVDASGCIVAPGVIDLHSHYDAQIQWDPYATLSSWFGVTSLSIGECGFGFAPTKPEDRDLNMRMMNRIEAIPLESMRKGMRWDWETFPEFMDSLDRQELGVNIGAKLPFSPLRGYVLGMIPARERTSVTEAELNQMKEIFYDGMKAGGFGLSSNTNLEDRPEDGGFLPTYMASKEEWFGLSEVLGQFGVGYMAWSIGVGHTPEAREAYWQLLKDMMRISGRPLYVGPGPDPNGEAQVKLARDEGLPVVTQRVSVPSDTMFTLAEYNLFDYLPNWVKPMLGTPEQRAVKLRNTETREVMKRDAENYPTSRTDWSEMKILEVVHERNHQYEGLTVQQLAEMTGKHPLDAWLDLALDEDLETTFTHFLNAGGEEALEPLIKSPYASVSIGDGGAHVRFLTQSTWPVYFLGHWVRDKEIMTLEQAHYKISSLPAWLAPYKDRGTLRLGAWGDVIVYNQEELGYLYDRSVYASDFPGGERRLIQKPTGMRYTIVNGAVTFEDNECTGALPGKLLRSYDMIS